MARLTMLLFGIVKKLGRVVRYLSFRWLLISFWREPGRSLFWSKSTCFLRYDHYQILKQERLTFLQRLLMDSYYRVYVNQLGRVIGYGLIERVWFFKSMTQFVRIYGQSEIKDDEYLQMQASLPLLNQPLEEVILWEVQEQFTPECLEGVVSYVYRLSDYLVEYLHAHNTNGLYVQGKNFGIEEKSKYRNFVRRYSSFDGLYRGYDEIIDNHLRTTLRLFYNEDDIVSFSERTSNRHLREISRYNVQGRKVSSEVYLGKILQKSAVFLYNEDSKLVRIIQYGPDGTVLN